MTIETMLEKAVEVKNEYRNLREEHDVVTVERLEKGEKTIDALLQIIRWYDENQKRLIKGFRKANKQTEKITTQLLYDCVCRVSLLKEYLNEDEREFFIKTIIKEYGGDAK